jgi:DNA repair protein RadC
METSYQRPREKLRQKGVASLSDTELLQVIISVGVPGIPVARIARKLLKVLHQKGTAVTLTDLTSVYGVGVIKAGQLLASFEFAKRHGNDGPQAGTVLNELLPELHYSIAASEQEVLVYVLLDGGSRVIGEDILNPSSASSRSLLVQNIFSQAVKMNAASVYVAFGCTHKTLEASLDDLTLLKDIYTTGKTLSVRIKEVVIVSSTGSRTVTGRDYV